jgi:hypothetical protein
LSLARSPRRPSALALPHRWLQNVIRLREKHPPTFAAVLSVACFVGFARTELELLTLGRPGSTVASLVNNVAFYLHVAYLFGLLAARAARKPLELVLGVVLIGVFVGVLPPVIDLLLFGLDAGRYTYVAGGLKSWKWSLIDPAHFSLGESIVLWSVVLLLTIYVAEVTRSLARTLSAAVGSYAVVTFISMGPSSLVEAVAPLSGGITSAQQLGLLSVVQLLVAQAAYLGARGDLFRRVLVRMPHALPFVALVFLGSSIAALYSPEPIATSTRFLITSLLALLIAQLCVTALVHNDAFDVAEDRGRKTADVSRDDAYFFTAMALLTIFAALAVSALVAAPLAIFLTVSIVYSFPFYRGKRFFPTNYKIEGAWAWSAFVLGASVSPLVVHRLKPSAAFLMASFLVFGGFSVFNAFKDYKDIRADRRAGNQTLYVLALRRGVRLRRLHRGLAGAFLVALVIPPALLLTTGGASLLMAAIPCLTLPFAAGAVYGPPRGSSVRAFLWSVTLYLVALTASIELSRGLS